jgi:N2-acetyl-L-2,4-diaminobutanoate deacetylase
MAADRRAFYYRVEHSRQIRDLASRTDGAAMTDPAIPELDSMPVSGLHRGSLIVSGGGDDAEIAFQVMIGTAVRPRLAVVAGIHGDEYDGIRALADLADMIAPASLAGSLLIVPVANPLAYRAAKRRAPADDTDLNRVFPGKPGGTISERMAHALTRLLGQADLVFTLHGGAAATTLAPWIEFTNLAGPVGRAAYAAAAASGFPDLVALPQLPGRLLSGMFDVGVPAIEGEVGGRAATRSDNVAWYRERVCAVARHAGVLDEPLPPRGTSPAWELCEIAAGAAGIFVCRVALRQAVHTGDILGEVIDPIRGRVAPLRAPADGLIGAIREHAGVGAEDQVFTLWCPATLAVV